MTGSSLIFGYELNLIGLLSGCLVRATYLSSTISRVFCLRFIVSDASFCALIPGIEVPLSPRVRILFPVVFFIFLRYVVELPTLHFGGGLY